jgi:hypothetical protein
MMPCKLCGLTDENGQMRRGVKQVGKTKRNGSAGERFYRCQDCGALWRLTFDTATERILERPVLRLVKGGA